VLEFVISKCYGEVKVRIWFKMGKNFLGIFIQPFSGWNNSFSIDPALRTGLLILNPYRILFLFEKVVTDQLLEMMVIL